MDPTTNPVPTPNPTSTPDVPPVAPTAPVAPVTSGDPLQLTATPVAPTISVASTASVESAAPVEPAVSSQPNTTVTSSDSVVYSTPVDSAINSATTAVNSDPVNPIFQPKNLDGIAATAPITQPGPVSVLDPAEEELKAPMKAAAPVPGSIGSAVSGPEAVDAPVEAPIKVQDTSVAGELVAKPFAAEAVGSTPSVAFTDPATQPDTNPATEAVNPVKKKTNKTTLIVLIVVAFMVVIALSAVLAIQLMKPVEPSKPETPTPAPVVEDNGEDGGGGEDGGTGVSGKLDTIICTATQSTMDQTSSQLDGVNVKDNIMTLNFMDDKLVDVEIKITVVDGSGAEEDISDKYTIDQLFSQSGVSKDDLIEQGVEFDESGSIIISKDQMMNVIQSNGMSGYTCVDSDRL